MEGNTDMALVKASFAIDATDAYDGWHDPAVRWNGFACPLFERVEADRIAEVFGLRYAAGDDAYSDETDVYAGTQRDDLHLYAIGDHGWTWLEAEGSPGD
jgi:hypothetical protein